MNWFKPTYRLPQKWVLLQVELRQQETPLLRYVIVDKQLQQAGRIDWTVVDTVEELVKKAGKSLPYVLHLTGFGVLSRISELVPHYRDGLLVNGSETDFYFSCYEGRSTVAVSFIRRSLVADLTEALTLHKLFVWAIHTGPVPLLALGREQLSVQFDYVIEMQAGEVKKLERNAGEQKRLATATGFLDRDAAYVRAMSQLFADPPEHYHQGLDSETQQSVRSNFKEFTRFIRLGMGILSFFLITLVGNYFYINHLNNRAAQLEADISGFGESLTMIDRLQQEKQRKLVLVENSGVQSAHYVSYYLDQIGASVPSTIQLTSLETFSLVEPLKPKRKVELESEKIVVNGFSSNSKVLDDWMEQLEAKKWIAGVELINYVRINDSKATFQLLIKLNE